MIVNNCAQLKYLIYSSNSSLFSHLSVQHYNLEQLCIRLYNLNTSIPDFFIQSVSAHGGLVHVVFSAGGFTGEGITALIENPLHLLTCHIYSNDIKSSATGATLNTKDLTVTLKRKFCGRKLIICGSLNISKNKDKFDSVVVEHDMDVLSLWPMLCWQDR